MTYTQNCSTPSGNTGSPKLAPLRQLITGHLDYLVVVGQCPLSELKNLLWSAFGTTFDTEGAQPGFRGRAYDRILKSAQGIELAVNDDSGEGDDTGNFRLCIGGAALGHVSSRVHHELIRYLHSVGCVCTRLDWAIDDYDNLLCLDDVSSCAIAGDYTGFRSTREYTSRSQGSDDVGRTIYFGSGQSEKIVRIYDKKVESKGEVPSIRYETQWRDDYAAVAFSAAAEAELRDLCIVMSQRAVGAITFIHRGDHVSPCHCRTYDWWLRFVAAVGGAIKQSPQRVQPLISDTIAWVERQVVGALLKISKIRGHDETLNWISRLISDRAKNEPSKITAHVQTFLDRLQYRYENLAYRMFLYRINQVYPVVPG